jgi:hypothetical protein
MNLSRISIHRSVEVEVGVGGLLLSMPGNGEKTRFESLSFVICVTALGEMSLKPMLPHDYSLAPA